MQETDLITEGFKFMALGMGTVFSFLIVLIGAMNLQAYIINKFFPEPAPIPAKPAVDNKAKIVAAITAAIKHHRSTK